MRQVGSLDATTLGQLAPTINRSLQFCGDEDRDHSPSAKRANWCHASLWPIARRNGSREIGFFADGYVRRVAVDTGIVHDIASAPVPAGGTWSADGVILFPIVPDSPIYRVTVGGEPPRPVTALTAGQGGHRQPHFLPDGRRVLFYSVGEPGARGVYVGDLTTFNVRKLLQSDAPAVFVPPDSLLYANEGTSSRNESTPAP